jgi:PKD repeat protein
MYFLKRTKFALLTFFSLTVVFLGACKKENVKLPIADFTFTVNGTTAPTSVSFVSMCENADAVKWDFGNGQSSTENNPTANFSVGGVYTVTLTATNSNGSNKITKTVNIQNEVKKLPIADFSFSGSDLRAPVQVAFNNLSQNATNYSWDFGNGQTSSLATPTATYTKGGVFTVTLTATSVNGTNKITKNITILNPYTKVGIEVLQIDKYPATKSDGSDWDGSLQGTYPDVYFEIVKSSDYSMIYSLATTSKKENLRTVDLPSSWKSTVAGSPFCDLITGVDFDVDLYDYESVSTDEYIGTAQFNWSNISTISNPYPSTIQSSTFGGVASKVGVTLKLIWKE